MIIKNVALPIGHSILKNGNVTSADGKSKGGVNEYTWCKDFVTNYLAPSFESQGVKAQVIVCPEKKFSKALEEKKYKLDIINNGNFDLVIESHLNAFNGSAKGTETLYHPNSSNGKKIAQAVNDKLDDIFTDRGAKSRDDLYILRDTKPVAILNEYFFCDSKSDYVLADEPHEKKLIARKVVEGVLGKFVEPSEPSKPSTFKNGDYSGKKAKVTATTLNVRYDRGTQHHVVAQIPKGTVVELEYCLNDWISIKGYKGRYGLGYVSTKYLQLL